MTLPSFLRLTGDVLLHAAGTLLLACIYWPIFNFGEPLAFKGATVAQIWTILFFGRRPDRVIRNKED